jgi:hypothetical protein
MRNRRHVQVATALVFGLTIAACGASAKPSASASGKGSPLAFARCMRTHGVTNFPDPTPGGGGGVQIRVGSGVNPFSPTFRSAQTACRKLLPGGGPPSGHASAQARALMLRTSECMRAHGISGFPDPTTTPPSSPAGYSAVMGRGGAFIAIPRTIDVRSPAFMQAASACGFGPKGARINDTSRP